MATESNTAGPDGSAFRDLSRTLDRYLSLKVSLLGVAFMILGYAVQFTNPAWTDSAVWSVTFFLWGLALCLLGLSMFLMIRWSHRGSTVSSVSS